MTYRLLVENRYESWESLETTTEEPLTIDPLFNKLLSGDVFSIDCNGKLQLINSAIRAGQHIQGVLILNDNKTYGRKNSRLLYKCIPNDKSLPEFLIPYEIKQVGFSKVFVNLYVTFTFSAWDDKHPHGTLNQVLGPVDVLENYYEYQIHCRKLNISIQKFQKETNLKTQDQDTLFKSIQQKYTSIENREDLYVFSIDPQGSVDFDDAFSIRELPDDARLVSIYIANVPVLIDALDLWDHISRRVSTIYLPNSKRPMLPAILSDCLCSLQANVTRVAFHMDVYITNGQIVDIKYGSSFVKLHKNYCYEEATLLNDSKYKALLKLVTQMSVKNKYVDCINDSHDVVSYLMILMNYHCAKEMLRHKTGIFRSTVLEKNVSIPNSVPEDVSKTMKILNSAKGQYVNGGGITNVRHELLDLEAYIHITSPIRRLVDLLNMIQFQQITGIIELPGKVSQFYNQWIDNLDYINISMKSIRRVQNDCQLLELCTHNKSAMDREYEGYTFHKTLTRKGLNQYTVFLPVLKLMSKITTNREFEDYQCSKFKLYLFNDEESLTRKIRLHLQT